MAVFAGQVFFCLVKFFFIFPYDIVASRFMLQRFEDSTSMVVHERTMLIFGGHDSSQVNEFNDPMGGMTVLIDRELGQETLMISYFGTSQDRNTQKWPLSLSSSKFFFVLHHAYSPHGSTHFVGNCHLLS